MKNSTRPKWEDVILFAREILDHGDQQILIEILKANEEQTSEEDLDASHERGMEKALGDKMNAIDYDAMASFSAQLLREFRRLPQDLAEFAADVLEGKRSRPTKPGPDPGRDIIRNIALSFTTEVVAKKFSLARYAKGNTNDETAVVAVSEAAKCTVNKVTRALSMHSIGPSLIAPVAARLGIKLDR